MDQDSIILSIQALLSIDNPVDYLITDGSLSLNDKIFLFDTLSEYLKSINYQCALNITEDTISYLLEIKEESEMYLVFYTKIINTANELALMPFKYRHLYHLILQMWMDYPLITNDFRKELIFIALNGQLITDIINQIENDVHIWFTNYDKNVNINDMITWLCHLDSSHRLKEIKDIYQKNINLLKEENKYFQKMYGMTLDEYNAQQERAKKNGLCKFIREGKECIHGVKCMFYHGKLEETYGIQQCRHGHKCSHLSIGECRFFHQPTETQMEEIKDFYGLLRNDEGSYYVPKYMEKYVDGQIRKNPFIILKKKVSSKDFVYYTIPKCECQSIDIYGVKKQCHGKIRFMSKNLSFYCSYEHMQTLEPKCSYVVKQNVIDNFL